MISFRVSSGTMPIALAQASAKVMVSGAVFDPPMISTSP